ncbi:MAG: hypothetical protein JNK26_01330 [Candidatus Doudnabacteria bacterium]|nr:hypothetical protein [Candidatus Doudnabacteria bacterium]
MNIKLIAPKVIQIEGDSASAVVEFEGGKAKDVDGGLYVSVNSEVVGAISGPGEYEQGGVELAMLETKEIVAGQAELAQVRIDNINVLNVLQAPGDLQKEQWELIDNVHILCMDAGIKIDEPAKFVNKINPYVLIVLNSDKETAEKWLGMTIESQDKKYKFSDKDFTAEEPVLRVLLLA